MVVNPHMHSPTILLVGAGGHSLACIDVLERQNLFTIQGLIGLDKEVGQRRLGYEVLGSDELLSKLAHSVRCALVCVGQINTPEPRIRVFQQLQELGYSLPSIVSPSATVSPHASIGAGSIIMHGAVVNAGARIGANCIINNLALVEHNTVIEDHCHISTGALVNGDAIVGQGCFVGSGSRIKEGITIGSRCIIGMGSNVLEDLPDGTKWLSKK